MGKKEFNIYYDTFFMIIIIATAIATPDAMAMRLFKHDKQPPDLHKLLIQIEKNRKIRSGNLYNAYKQTIIKQQKEPKNKIVYDQALEKLLNSKHLEIYNAQTNGFAESSIIVRSKEEIAHYLWCCICHEKKNNNFFIEHVPTIIKDYALKHRVLKTFKTEVSKDTGKFTEEFRLINLLRADAILPDSLSLIEACKTNDKKIVTLSLFADWRKDHSTLQERLNDVESLFYALKIAQQNGLLKWMTKIKPISRYIEYYKLAESTKSEKQLHLLTKDLYNNKKNAQEIIQLWLSNTKKLHDNIIKYLKHWDEKTIQELVPFYAYPFIWLGHKNFAGLLHNNLQLNRNYVVDALMRAAPEHIIDKLKRRQFDIITIFCEKRNPNFTILARLLVMIYGQKILIDSRHLPKTLKKSAQIYPKIIINLHQEQGKFVSIREKETLIQNLYACLIKKIMCDIMLKLDA